MGGRDSGTVQVRARAEQALPLQEWVSLLDCCFIAVFRCFSLSLTANR